MSHQNNDTHDFNTFGLFVSNLSIIGISYSTCAAFFSLAIHKAAWSIRLLVSIFLPFIFLSLLYVIIAICIRFHSNIRIPYVSQQLRTLFCLLFILLSVFILLLWKQNRAPETIDIQDLSIIHEQHHSEPYYVIFKSENCTYCSQMEKLYIKTAKENPSASFYYVDLTYVSLLDETVVAHNIKSIPCITAYQGQRELDRLEGLASPEMLQALIVNTGGG